MSKKRKPSVKSVKRRKWDDDQSQLVFRSSHMVSLLVLLNNGCSPEELKRFNDQFNVVLSDVCSGLLSFADIIDAVTYETGFTLKDLNWESEANV